MIPPPLPPVPHALSFASCYYSSTATLGVGVSGSDAKRGEGGVERVQRQRSRAGRDSRIDKNFSTSCVTREGREITD